MNEIVLAVIDDMFFSAKIRATAEAIGVGVKFVRSVDAVVQALRENRVRLVIVDLHQTRLDPFALAVELKAKEDSRDVPLVGFFSHVQVELQRRAKSAGYDRVLPRSMFTKKLAEILVGDGDEENERQVEAT